LANKFENCHIGAGNWKRPANSPLKGERGPIVEMWANLRSRGTQITFIDEYGTSKLCANCHFVNGDGENYENAQIMNALTYIPDAQNPGKTIPEYKPAKNERVDFHLHQSDASNCEKVVVCSNGCRCIMNRDHNASINIFELLKRKLADGNRPVALDRSIAIERQKQEKRRLEALKRIGQN